MTSPHSDRSNITATDAIVTSYPSKIFKDHNLIQLAINEIKPNRGRGLFLKSDIQSKIKPGTTLLSLSPHVAVLDTSSLSTRCSSCFLEDRDFQLDCQMDIPTTSVANRSIRRCGKCKVVAYCGSSCQQLDWEIHKLECKSLSIYAKLAEEATKANEKSKSRIGAGGSSGSLKDSFGLGGDETDDDPQTISRVPSATVRALGRLIWKKPKEEKLNPDWWTGLSELEYHLCDYTSNQKESLMQLSITLSRYVGNNELRAVFESASSLVPFCSRFIDNSFTLTSTTLDSIGVIFVPSASFINHSCSPNSVVVFPEGGEGSGSKTGKEWVQVIAIKPIEAGEEIVTSYIDSAATRQERRNELHKLYKFTCDCTLCQSDWNDQIDPREALKCPKCTNWFSIDCYESPGASRFDAGPSTSHKTARKEITCLHCGFSRWIDIDGQRSAIKKSGKALDPVKEPAKAAYYAEKAIEWFQSKVSPFTFGPGFYPILDLRRMRMTSYLMRPHKSNIKQAMIDVQQIMTGVHQIYGVGHPTSIITRSTVAKLYAYIWSSSTIDSDASLSGSQSADSKIQIDRMKFEIQLLENLKLYHTSAYEECLIGFGAASRGGRMGRAIASSIELTEREIIGRQRILQSFA